MIRMEVPVFESWYRSEQVLRKKWIPCLLEDADENINVLVCIKISEIEVIGKLVWRTAHMKTFCAWQKKTIYGEYLHKNVLKM